MWFRLKLIRLDETRSSCFRVDYRKLMPFMPCINALECNCRRNVVETTPEIDSSPELASREVSQSGFWIARRMKRESRDFCKYASTVQPIRRYVIDEFSMCRTTTRSICSTFLANATFESARALVIVSYRMGDEDQEPSVHSGPFRSAEPGGCARRSGSVFWSGNTSRNILRSSTRNAHSASIMRPFLHARTVGNPALRARDIAAFGRSG